MIAPPASVRESAREAWAGLAAGGPPLRVEVIQGKGDTIVLRLVGAGPLGEDVAAQWFRPLRAPVERAVHEMALPADAARPKCWGFVAEGECAWAFFEYVEGRRFRPSLPGDRRLAARWLAALHGSEAERPLPELDLDQWRARAERAREAAVALNGAGLDRLADLLGKLDSDWERLTEAATLLPSTLVHGDFAQKNLLVREDASAPVLMALDWGEAGHGPPAVDLAQGLPGTADPDLDLYAALRGERDSSLTVSRVKAAARVGTILRAVSGAAWATEREPGSLNEYAHTELEEYTAAIETWLAAR